MSSKGIGQGQMLGVKRYWGDIKHIENPISLQYVIEKEIYIRISQIRVAGPLNIDRTVLTELTDFDCNWNDAYNNCLKMMGLHDQHMLGLCHYLYFGIFLSSWNNYNPVMLIINFYYNFKNTVTGFTTRWFCIQWIVPFDIKLQKPILC